MDPSNITGYGCHLWVLKTSALNSLHTCSTFLSSFSSITLSPRHVESGEVQTGNTRVEVQRQGVGFLRITQCLDTVRAALRSRDYTQCSENWMFGCGQAIPSLLPRLHWSHWLAFFLQLHSISSPSVSVCLYFSSYINWCFSKISSEIILTFGLHHY